MRIAEKPFHEEVKELTDLELRKKFDKLAEMRRGEDNLQRFIIESAAKYLKKGDEVLDLGAGSGKYAAALSKLGMKVTALDFSKGVHRIMKDEMKELGVRYKQMMADGGKLPYNSESFDGVIFFCTNAFIKREDVPVWLMEIERVLKPGGKLIAAFSSTASEVYTISKSPLNDSKTLKVIGFEAVGLSSEIPINFFDKKDFESYLEMLKKNFKLRESYHDSIYAPMGGGQYINDWKWYLVAEKKRK